MLLDEDEVETINGINTLSEMSSGEYCTPEGRSPDVGNIECCSGLRKYEETGLCEICTISTWVSLKNFLLRLHSAWG